MHHNLPIPSHDLPRDHVRPHSWWFWLSVLQASSRSSEGPVGPIMPGQSRSSQV